MPYDRILDLMSPPGTPQLYVLGAYAKRVTIYSQQVRAINLVDAIENYRCKLGGLRIAVVGGGIAGLTAAARALKYGAKVSIFERTADFISIQSEANHRWVHPHLYEWPNEKRGLQLTDSAELPVLDWKAQTAKELSITLRAMWNEIAEAHAECVEELRSTVVTGVESNSGGYQVAWTDLANVSTPGIGNFDMVILALGYGLEPKAAGKNSYWRPDGVDWIGQPGQQRVLIAGYGDGALTDLMRLCLVNFSHEGILKDVIAALQPSDIQRIRGLEEDILPDEAHDLTERYSGIHLPKVVDVLHGKLNKLRKVVLTGPGPDLFDPAASTLNRLVVSQLLHMGAFQHIPLAPGRRIEKADDDPAIVEILRKTDPKLPSFTDIVLRFGTKKLLPSEAREPTVALGEDGLTFIRGLPESLKTLRERWADLLPSDDPTRRQLWRLLEPVWCSSAALQSNPPTSANLERYCLTIQPASAKPQGNWLPQLVTTTAMHLRAGRVLPFDPIPVVLAADDCVGSQEALEFTARALSRAPIAIFNLGGAMGQENPAGMLLLGIRAAVRRWLTLVIVDRSDHEPDWDALPFNIKELLVLPLRRGEVAALVNVLASGWTSAHSETRGYRDLPVFDAVRQYERRTPGVAAGRVEMFALCPFSPDYMKSTWPELRTLIEGLGAGAGKLFDVRPVTEYLSPMLVGERLYDLARFADRCIVDWTYWRANVFFELGVRLAVNSIPPICVIKSDQQSAARASATLLRTFSPIPYDLEREASVPASKFGREFLKAEREISGPRARLSQVYAAAERNAAIDQEVGFLPLEQELTRQVKSMIGSDLGRAGGLTFLYHRNASLSQRVWHNSVDRLDAALLLIGSKIKALKPGDDGYRRLDTLRDDIESMLQDMRQIGRERGYSRYDEVVDGPL
jgi:hypothetical protein